MHKLVDQQIPVSLSLSQINKLKKKKKGPNWCGSAGWALSRKPKIWFDPSQGTSLDCVPGPRVGGMSEATGLKKQQ